MSSEWVTLGEDVEEIKSEELLVETPQLELIPVPLTTKEEEQKLTFDEYVNCLIALHKATLN